MAAVTQYATGRRKCAIARAWVTGTAGDITVNETAREGFSSADPEANHSVPARNGGHGEIFHHGHGIRRRTHRSGRCASTRHCTCARDDEPRRARTP